MVTLDQRKTDVNQYLVHAQQIVNRTQLSEARTILSFLRRFGQYATPLNSPPEEVHIQPQGWIYGRAGKRGHRVLIIPLYPEDIGHFGDVWNKLCAAAPSAMYAQKFNTIFIRPNLPETGRLIATDILHEGGHAQRAFLENRCGHPIGSVETPPRWLYPEERDMHLLEGLLWNECNTDAYQKALAAGTEHIRAVLKRDGQEPGTLAVGLPEYLQVLDEVLGPAPNDAARESRKVRFDVQANFAIIDQSEVKNKPGTKTAIVEAVRERVLKWDGTL